MHPFLRSHIRIRQRGQTLVIALIVLGVLLILGLVFLGLINRNILNAARSQRRSESSDLAEAGIRYAHGQLVSSPQGADWRGLPVSLTPTAAGGNLTGDPDAYYLRPRSGIDLAPGQPDLGGPDGYGPYVRVNFPAGRALVRVRYGAADASPTKLVAGGPLRNLGAARSTIIVEGVGRTGVVNENDPTTFNATGGLQFRGFGSANALLAGIAAMAKADGQLPTSRRLVAYVPIGIIDAARFETNVFNSSAPIDLGIADGLGAVAFNDVDNRADPTKVAPTDVSADLEMTLGAAGDIRNAGRYGGSLIANGDVLFHGTTHAYMNRTLGDTIRVAGRIYGQNGATLNLTTYSYAPGIGYRLDPTQPPPLTDGAGGASFNSQRSNFSTVGGLLYDGSPRTDTAGYASGVGALVPPSTQTVDPETKLNRYVALTRESGRQLGGTDQRNAGQFGHGGGVYVDNVSDRQEATDAEGRKTVGSQQSLFDDYLHPNSGTGNSGWAGPFYVPRGAVVQLLPDGFLIQRDGTAPAAERTWKNPDGSDSGLTTLRYRIGSILANGVPTLYVLDTITARAGGQSIDDKDLDYTKGLPFNGVLYFEGNVRVRGTIPTGVQLTMVSGATVYVDGTISKGVVTNDVVRSGTANRVEPIKSLPTAALMLMAKDNVVVNTTMFFGPTAGQRLESVSDAGGAAAISPVRVRAEGSADTGQLETMFDLALDPDTTGGNALSPNTWEPFALTYRAQDTGLPIPTQLLIAHTMDDGTAAASFLALDVNYGVGAGASGYEFNASDPLITNTAAAYAGAGAGTTLPLYGLGAEPWQRYSRFETRSFPLIPDPNTATYDFASGLIGQGAPYAYTMQSSGNDLLIRPGAIAGVSTNDTLVGRVAVTPAEVRIEASMFAEQGSFFVIPGPWFNPNPNDTHVDYATRVKDLMQNSGLALDAAKARANRDRLDRYGSAPYAPFYGEPLDVRLTVVGSVAENLPPPIAVQSEWVRKWGWIPIRQGASDVAIPKQHVPPKTGTYDPATKNYVPNLAIQYDSILATGRLNNVSEPSPIRTDAYGRPLPPMPRLPVSPKLSYFGEL